MVMVYNNDYLHGTKPAVFQNYQLTSLDSKLHKKGVDVLAFYDKLGDATEVSVN